MTGVDFARPPSAVPDASNAAIDMASAGRAPAQPADDLVTSTQERARPVTDDRRDTLTRACPSDIVDTNATRETANVVRLAEGSRLPS